MKSMSCKRKFNMHNLEHCSHSDGRTSNNKVVATSFHPEGVVSGNSEKTQQVVTQKKKLRNIFFYQPVG